MNNRKNTILLLVIFLLAALAGVFVFRNDLFGRGWRLGLDLQGGSYLVYDIDLGGVPAGEAESLLGGLRDVMEKRVNAFGVSEPQVYIMKSREGAQLIVELAGVKDTGEAIRQIGRTALLDFREVSDADNEENGVRFNPTELSGRYLKKAAVVVNPNSGFPEVSLQFINDGSLMFEEITGRNIGKPLAIFLDDALISSPVVNDKIAGGEAIISGQFSYEEAKQLTNLLNAGALPAPVTLVSQQTIGASLGQDSLTKSIYAGIAGTIIIAVFMIAYYRSLGLTAVIALAIYILFTLALFKLLPIFTITLAGIAGFLLSVGMAVDANILIFERTKEELKRGLPREAALNEGFRRAWSSIRDSNFTTIISSVILYYFTSSFVRGFALTLLVGVLVSMFSAIFVSRLLLKVFVFKGSPSTGSGHNILFRT